MQISQVNSAAYAQTTPSSGSGDVVAEQRATAQPAAAPVEMPTRAVRPANEVVDAQLLSRSVDKLNQAVKMIESNIQFTVDEETGLDVVKVVDSETDEVIRQFPSEEIIEIAKALDKFQGMLLRDKA